VLAETARLAVNLSLEGNFGSGIRTAETQLAGLNATAAGTTGKLAGAFGSVKGAALGMGGALAHAGGQIKGLLTGPLGMLGIGAGLFGVASLFKESIGKASEFAFAIEKLQGLTNDSADSLAQLIAVTDNYGISADRLSKVVGFAEKTMGNLATTAGGADAFFKKFGFSITNAQGKVLPFTTVLEKAADFYNSNADQSTKAALAATLFGRSYADLVPILKLGGQGIRDAEAAAKDLGITLTQTNVQDLQRFRETTREMDDAMTGLKLQIGLGLVPAFTDLAKATTGFVRTHRDDIVAFFKNAVETGRAFAKVAGDVVSGLATAWNAIPPPLRDFIVKGVVADRTIKFLFGFDPVAALGKGILGALGGTFLGRGSPTNPMFVVPVGPGGLGGALGGVGLGSVAKVAAAGAATGLAVGAVYEVQQAVSKASSEQAVGIHRTLNTSLASGPSDAQLRTQLAAIDTGIKQITDNPLMVLVQGSALDELRSMRADVAAQLQLQGKRADDLVVPLPKGAAKAADIQAANREANRITKQAAADTTRKIDYAKVAQVRAIDDAAAATDRARDAIVRAILGLNLNVNITTASVMAKTAETVFRDNITTGSRRGGR
jgi:hypothetical protein